MRHISDATLKDARHLAYLVNLAGEGMPFYFWRSMCTPGQAVIDHGTERATRETGDFSYRNARIYRQDGEVTSALIAFQLDDPYQIDDLETCPDYIHPLIHLEAKGPGDWYINVLAVYEPYRRKGIANALLEDSFRRGRKAECTATSLIVHSTNEAAKQLYENKGFSIADELPVIPIPGTIEGGMWQRLVKKL
jgi:ribosomal protein S18 acetylase RimI-like enzyme